MVTSTTVGLSAAAAAAAFIGYCVYFDHKRRSHPDFRKNLAAKRRQQKANGGSGGGSNIQMPDMRDQEAVQSFFLEQVQLGEQLLAQGQVETGVEHLAMAVAVCGQPRALLGVLQQTIPPQIFPLLLQSLEKAQQRVRAVHSATIASMNPGGSIEDLE